MGIGGEWYLIINRLISMELPKMHKKVFLIIFFLVMGIAAECKKIASFVDHFKSPNILMDEKQYYVWDSSLRKIVIYKRDNLEKVAEFGSKGQGPGEFMAIKNVNLTDDYIYVASYPKVCVFSKNGKLKKEIKGPVEFGGFIPFGNNFIGKNFGVNIQFDEKTRIQFTLFDGNLDKMKDIFLTEIKSYIRHKGGKDIVLWIRDCVDAIVYKDRLYIGTTEKGFYFAVFNLEGNLIYKIKKKEEKRRITSIEKSNIIDGLKKGLGENGWKAYKSRFEITFGEYYPAYKAFFINDDKIYVFRFPMDDKYEMVILDLKGNTLTSNFKQVKDLIKLGQGFNHIQDGKYYYISENDELEVWELHEIDLM